MKTQNNKLIFKTSSVSELNTKQLHQINGGTGMSPMMPSIIILTPVLNGSQGEDMQSGQQ